MNAIRRDPAAQVEDAAYYIHAITTRQLNLSDIDKREILSMFARGVDRLEKQHAQRTIECRFWLGAAMARVRVLEGHDAHGTDLVGRTAYEWNIREQVLRESEKFYHVFAGNFDEMMEWIRIQKAGHGRVYWADAKRLIAENSLRIVQHGFVMKNEQKLREVDDPRLKRLHQSNINGWEYELKNNPVKPAPKTGGKQAREKAQKRKRYAAMRDAFWGLVFHPTGEEKRLFEMELPSGERVEFFMRMQHVSSDTEEEGS